MSFDANKAVDVSLASEVLLAGRKFMVAPLSLRQVIALADELPKVTGLTVDNINGERLGALAKIVMIGLSRVYPDVSQDEFFDLNITIPELVVALGVVVQQAGGKKLESGEGEPSAASASRTPTGAGSSPTS